MNDALSRYWSFGRGTLGLSESDFWSITPREFQSLCDKFAEGDRRTAARFALVCSVIANCNRDPEKRPEPYSAADFMPGGSTEPKPEQSWDTQKAIFSAFAEAAKRQKVNPNV